MPDLSLQGLTAFSAIPQQMSNNFFAGPNNQAALNQMNLQNQALQIANQYNPQLLQNQVTQGGLTNQALQQEVPYAGQQAQANVGLTQAQGGLAGAQSNLANVQAQNYPQVVAAKLAQAGVSPLKYASPEFKAGYDQARLHGQTSFGGIPIFNSDAQLYNYLSPQGLNSSPQPNPQNPGLFNPQQQNGIGNAYNANTINPNPAQVGYGLTAPQQSAGYQLGQNSGGLPVGGMPLLPPNSQPQNNLPVNTAGTIENQTSNAINQKIQNPASPQLTLQWQRASNLMQTMNMLKEYLSNIPDLNKYAGATGQLNYQAQELLPKGMTRDPGYYQMEVLHDSILPAFSKQLQKYAVGSTNGNLLLKTEDQINPFGSGSTVPGILNNINAMQDVVNREAQTAAIGAGKTNEYENLKNGFMADGSKPSLPLPSFANKDDKVSWIKSLSPKLQQHYLQQISQPTNFTDPLSAVEPEATQNG